MTTSSEPPGTGQQREPLKDCTFFGGKAQLIALSEHKDARGVLLPLEFPNMPFQPARVFVIHGVPAGTTRGGHAHRQGFQLLVCITGRLLAELRYKDERQTWRLERSDMGLLIGPGVWSEQTYQDPDTTLMVLASTHYDPAAYLPGEA